MLGNEDMEGAGSRKSSNVISGDHFSEVKFVRGDRLNFTLFSPKSTDPPLPPPPTQAINNDRSLREISVWSVVSGQFL